MKMIGICRVIPWILVIFFLTISGASIAQEGRGTFKVFENEPSVIDSSKNMKESGIVFRDTNNDGVFDSLKAQGKELSCTMDLANAYGVSYIDGKNVVYYPSSDATIPKPGDFMLYGFIHYFDKQGTSLYFAIVVQALSEKEQELLRKSNKKVLPYKCDFIDSNGLRVGIPTLLLLPNAKLTYNAEFQKFAKSKNTILMGTNPAAPARELYIFRKIPNFNDNLLLIHYKWY